MARTSTINLYTCADKSYKLSPNNPAYWLFTVIDFMIVFIYCTFFLRKHLLITIGFTTTPPRSRWWGQRLLQGERNLRLLGVPTDVGGVPVWKSRKKQTTPVALNNQPVFFFFFLRKKVECMLVCFVFGWRSHLPPWSLILWRYAKDKDSSDSSRIYYEAHCVGGTQTTKASS